MKKERNRKRQIRKDEEKGQEIKKNIKRDGERNQATLERERRNGEMESENQERYIFCELNRVHTALNGLVFYIKYL